MTHTQSLPEDAAQLGEDLMARVEILVRAAWCRDDANTWHLRLIDIIDGPCSTSGFDHEWQYPSVYFSSRALPGHRVGNWLKEGRLITGDGAEHALERPADRLQLGAPQKSHTERLRGVQVALV